MLAAAFACVKFVLHVATNLWQAHLGWGYFVDEPYYIMCGRHLDWGYVDHGPIVALQARLALLLFGQSLAGIRMFAAMAGATKIFLTGLLAWQLGARRWGQALAMSGALVAGNFLAIDSFLSMNCFEPIFWMTAVFVILRIIESSTDGPSTRWWIVFGVAAGIGLENKPSMLVFLVALFFGLLLTPERRILFNRDMWIAVAIAFALVLPNLLWQAHHDWATLRFIHHGKVMHKNPVVGPVTFIYAQIYLLGPWNLPLWGGGLLWLLMNKAALRFRALGWTYLMFLGLMMASRDANSYYLAPAYPMLFAAGGCAAELLTKSPRQRWLIPAYTCLILILGALTLPMAIPILPPQTMVEYAGFTHLVNVATNPARQKLSPLPQFYADRFGWQELADSVTRIYHALPAADRAHTGIQCMNYEEASAINVLGAGRGLPFAISGHNNYYLWGPHGETGEVMILVSSFATKEQLLTQYASVEVVGDMNHPYAMPGARATIYLCRGRKRSLLTDWPYLRTYL